MKSNGEGEDFGAKTVYKGGIEVTDSTYQEFFQALKAKEVAKKKTLSIEKADGAYHFEEIEISGIPGETDESLEGEKPELVVPTNNERLAELRGAISENGDKNPTPAPTPSLKGPTYQQGYIGDSGEPKSIGIFERIKNLWYKVHKRVPNS